MALLQDILGQLTDMGFGAYGQGTGEEFEGQAPLDYMSISQLSPSTISQTLQNYFGLQQQDLPAHMFQGISSDILQSGLGKTYSPQVEAHGSSLLSKLREKTGGQKGKRAFGGFAGSGQQQKYTAGARDVYGKGMSDVLAQTQQQQAQGLQSVQDVINQWRETAAGIKGY
tara:strand:+ start:11980 stop:12489 length:510 start_codon:yes stop_codon:yes gene_type:complete